MFFGYFYLKLLLFSLLLRERIDTVDNFEVRLRTLGWQFYLAFEQHLTHFQLLIRHCFSKECGRKDVAKKCESTSIHCFVIITKVSDCSAINCSAEAIALNRKARLKIGIVELLR